MFTCDIGACSISPWFQYNLSVSCGWPRPFYACLCTLILCRVLDRNSTLFTVCFLSVVPSFVTAVYLQQRYNVHQELDLYTWVLFPVFIYVQ